MELGVTSSVSVLNPDVGDLALESTGTEVVLTDPVAEVCQRLRVRLNFFKGEWFLNLDAGTPWYQLIFVKDPKDRIIRAVFGSVIRNTEGISELLSLSYSINARTRVMELRFRARLQDGTTFVSTDYGPFIVAV